MIPRPRRIVRTFPRRSPHAPAGRSMKTRAAGSAPTRAPARNADAPRYRPYCGTAGLMIEIPIITRNTVPERTATVRRIDVMLAGREDAIRRKNVSPLYRDTGPMLGASQSASGEPMVDPVEAFVER